MTGSAGPAGLVSVVGIGPGEAGTCTPDVVERVRRATDLVGYAPYLDMVTAAAGAPPGAARHASGNRGEADRARHALDLAAAGGRVAVVSSGDPGVFAMAAVVMEQLDADAGAPVPRWAAVEVEVLAGVTAAQAAAARVGAPLGHDFCVVSLSDNLKPWPVIERRLAAAAGADFVIALYNPVSRHRPWQLARAAELLAANRIPSTPVVVARDVGRPGATVRVVPLGELAGAQVDMRTVLVVGSSTTRCFTRPCGDVHVYTPRTYPGAPC
ncbi:MAG TPA: precorrin-3B C(17)-methyltransferase [Acidimicrobiales bacterium]|nr:precorrin-3B C(17)-methyltransferase [Acidimicrobiales bacterium]